MTLHANRRHFIAGSAVGLAGLAVGCSGAESSPAQNEETAPFYQEMLGVQLYTVRSLFETDPLGTLTALAEIGIKDCESAGFFDHDLNDVRKMMDDLGLVSRSGHIRLPDLRDGFGAQLQTAHVIGQTALFLGCDGQQKNPVGKKKLTLNPNRCFSWLYS